MLDLIRRLRLTAAKLIALRVAMAIVAVAIFSLSPVAAYLTMALFLANDVVDLFDGLLPEVQGEEKPFGGFLDISADQCIETLFWFLFLLYGLVPLWIPAVILVRNGFINLLRVTAISEGRSMFGPNGMLRSRFARRWVGQRVSRGVMVVFKTVGFVALILLHIGEEYGEDWIPGPAVDLQVYETVGLVSLTLLVAIHVFRGAVITWESRDLLGKFQWAPSGGG